jgi:hypothetical protein
MPIAVSSSLFTVFAELKMSERKKWRDLGLIAQPSPSPHSHSGRNLVEL